MKKRIIVAALAFASLFAITGCGKEKEIKDEQIFEIYTLYQNSGGTLTYDEWLASIKGAQGNPGTPGEPGAAGAAGVGIKSIVKTKTEGLVDTYTITLTDNTTSTFTITNAEAKKENEFTMISYDEYEPFRVYDFEIKDGIIYYYRTELMDGEFVPTDKEEIKLDSQNRPLLVAKYEYNVSLNDYIGTNKSIYEYGENNKDREKTNYLWDRTLNDWVTSTKNTEIYGQNGKDEYYKKCSWNANTNTWDVTDEKMIHFTIIEGVEISLESRWNSTAQALVNYRKLETKKDEQGNYTLQAVYSWDASTESWKTTSKMEYEYDYDTKGKILSSVSYLWLDDSEEFFSKILCNYEYTATGKVKSETYLVWDKTKETFINREKDEYEYYGKLFVKVKSSWDTDLSTWVKENKYDYLDYEKHEDLSESYSELTTYTWDSTTDSWVLYFVE